MVRRFVQPAILVNPFLIMLMMTVYQFEHQFIKTFAALISTTVAALLIQRLVRKTFVKSFGVMPLTTEEPARRSPSPRRAALSHAAHAPAPRCRTREPRRLHV